MTSEFIWSHRHTRITKKRHEKIKISSKVCLVLSDIKTCEEGRIIKSFLLEKRDHWNRIEFIYRPKYAWEFSFTLKVVFYVSGKERDYKINRTVIIDSLVGGGEPNLKFCLISSIHNKFKMGQRFICRKRNHGSSE